MFAWRSPITWLRLTFGWSTSTQTWQERVGDLSLFLGLAAALVITVFFGLSWPQVILVWTSCLLPAFFFSYLGWLKIFGPVLYYDVIRQARRSRFIVLRFLYALLLVIIFLLVTISHSASPFSSGTNINLAAQIAETYFELFMVAQFLTVVLLTPAFVAAAISDEKDRKTLEFMLATDLLNREIILSKLGSRMGNLGLVVLTGLPILGILQFLGGVDPNLVLAGFVVTVMTILGLGGVSILFSTICKKPRDSIGLAYLTVVTYYALSLFLYTAVRFLGPEAHAPVVFDASIEDLRGFYNKGNLVSLIAEVKTAGYRGSLATQLPVLTTEYAIFHGGILVGCAVLAIARLRRSALAQGSEKPSKSRGNWFKTRRPAIGVNPMLWKEIHCENRSRSHWLGWVIFVLLLAITFAPAVLIFLNFPMRSGNWRVDLARNMNEWVCTANCIVGCLTLLAIAVRASTSVTSEREKQTYETLLTTPLGSRAILGPKWFGSLIGVRTGIICLTLIWAVGIVTGGLSIFALPFVIAAIVIYGAFAAALGLWFSVVCRSSQRAVVFTIFSMIGLNGGHWLLWACCIPVFFASPSAGRELEIVAKIQMGTLTPPASFVMFPLYFHALEFNRGYFNNEMHGLFVFCLGGFVVWIIATGILFSFADVRFSTIAFRNHFLPKDGRGTVGVPAKELHPPPAVPFSPWSPPVAPAEETQPPENNLAQDQLDSS